MSISASQNSHHFPPALRSEVTQSVPRQVHIARVNAYFVRSLQMLLEEQALMQHQLRGQGSPDSRALVPLQVRDSSNQSRSPKAFDQAPLPPTDTSPVTPQKNKWRVALAVGSLISWFIGVKVSAFFGVAFFLALLTSIYLLPKVILREQVENHIGQGMNGFQALHPGFYALLKIIFQTALFSLVLSSEGETWTLFGVIFFVFLFVNIFQHRNQFQLNLGQFRIRVVPHRSPPSAIPVRDQSLHGPAPSAESSSSSTDTTTEPSSDDPQSFAAQPLSPQQDKGGVSRSVVAFFQTFALSWFPSFDPFDYRLRQNL